MEGDSVVMKNTCTLNVFIINKCSAPKVTDGLSAFHNTSEKVNGPLDCPISVQN